MDNGLRLMAQMYVGMYDKLEDWPNVVLPNYQTSALLTSEIGGCDRVGLAVSVQPEDLTAYESFMIHNWDSDPNIPTGSAGIYNAAGARGVWAVNASTDGILAALQRPFHGETPNFYIYTYTFDLSLSLHHLPVPFI
jgi:hypothetical protein